MISLRYSNLPVYLHDSELYRTLDENDSSTFEVPRQCYRDTEDEIETVEDLMYMRDVIRYWGVTRIPQGVLEFCWKHEPMVWNGIVEDFKDILSETFVIPKWLSFEKALLTGKSEFVDFWLSKYKKSTEGIELACRFGRFDLVLLLLDREWPMDDLALCAAAHYGHLDILKYLFEICGHIDQNCIIYAACGGQLECIKYLRSVGCPWTDRVTLEYAVPLHYALLDSIDFRRDGSVRSFSSGGDRECLSCVSPANGYFECLRYALKNGCPIHKDASVVVCTYGLLDCLMLLHQYNAPWDARTACAAASFGLLYCYDGLDYVNLYDSFWYFDVSADATAAAPPGGHLACLTYLIENGCPWNENAITTAAVVGNLACLRFLHELGGTLTVEMAETAACDGYLDCLRYLFENGCPYEDNIVDIAVSSRNLEVLRFVIEEQGLYMDSDGSALHRAFTIGHLSGVQYLMDVMCPVPIKIYDDFDFNSQSLEDMVLMECVRFAWDRRLPLCSEFLSSVAWSKSGGSYDITKAYICSSIDGYAIEAQAFPSIFTPEKRLRSLFAGLASESQVTSESAASLDSESHCIAEIVPIEATPDTTKSILEFLCGCCTIHTDHDTA